MRGTALDVVGEEVVFVDVERPREADGVVFVRVDVVVFCWCYDLFYNLERLIRK